MHRHKYLIDDVPGGGLGDSVFRLERQSRNVQRVRQTKRSYRD